MNQKKETLNVLHERDLKEFLINSNLYEDIEKKRILCKFCKKPVSLDNIYAIVIIDDIFEFVCDKESCYNKFQFFNEGKNDS